MRHAIVPQRVGPRKDRMNRFSFMAGIDNESLGLSTFAISVAKSGSRARGQKGRTHRDSRCRKVAMA